MVRIHSIAVSWGARHRPEVALGNQPGQAILIPPGTHFADRDPKGNGTKHAADFHSTALVGEPWTLLAFQQL